MRNKIILAICSVAIAAIFTACSRTTTVVPSSLHEIPVTTKNIEVAMVKGDSKYNPQTLQEVEDLGDYIVKGRLLDDAKQKLYCPEPGTVTFGVTVSSFEITDVYKGNLKEGDKIPIAERYYTLEEKGEMTRYELGYAPSTPNKEYIFFLSKEDDFNEFLRGFYTPSVKETGRYPVINTKDSNAPNISSMTAEELNLVATEPTTYQKIYQQVIDKYMK